MKTRKYLSFFAAYVLLQTLFFYSSFYVNLHSTISEWAGYGINWPIQLFHNFIFGRPLQSSLYASPGGGVAVGFVGNPFAYVHSYVVHVNVFPYLFAYVWALHPTLSMLYTVIFAWNLVCGSWLTMLILKHLAPDDFRPKALFALSVFFGAGLLSIMDQFAQPLLFVGPLMMAAYYFFLTRRRWWFLAAIAAVCLTGEDASMMAVSFAGYFFLFEGKEGRAYGLLATALAVPYMMLVLFVVQPAARADLTVFAATNMSNAFKHILELKPAELAENFKSLWPLFTILPVFAMAGPLFGWPAKAKALPIAALGLVTTAPYWVECFTRGGGHHNLPPFISSYLALLALLGAGSAKGKEWLERRVPAPTLAATAAFLLFSVRVQSNNLPNAVKPALYRLTGKAAKAEALERSLQGESASNLATIAAIKALPPEKTLTYLTNNQATGFFLDRTEVWQCADTVQNRYAFEQTDYFIVQKDGVNMTCCLNAADADDFSGVVRKASNSSALNCPMTSPLLGKIRDQFIRSGSHRVAYEDEHVLLLENLRPARFVSPPDTVGLGWTANLFKKAKLAPRPVN